MPPAAANDDEGKRLSGNIPTGVARILRHRNVPRQSPVHGKVRVMKQVRNLVGACAVIAALFGGAQAQAALVVGDTVRLGGFMGATAFNSTAALADPGIEFNDVQTSGFNAFDLDVTTDGFVITFNTSLTHNNSTGRNEIVLADLDPTLAAAAITFQNTSTAAALLFDDHSVTVRWNSPTTHLSGQRVVVSITTVPEPGSLVLAGLALAIGGAATRRKRA